MQYEFVLEQNNMQRLIGLYVGVTA